MFCLHGCEVNCISVNMFSYRIRITGVLPPTTITVSQQRFIDIARLGRSIQMQGFNTEFEAQELELVNVSLSIIMNLRLEFLFVCLFITLVQSCCGTLL